MFVVRVLDTAPPLDSRRSSYLRGPSRKSFPTEPIAPLLFTSSSDSIRCLFGPQRSAPYVHMAKPYHPCYTTVNPAGEARKYTTERIFCRKVTLTYDWLPPHTQVEGWLRRVPYRLEGGDTEGSWIVKYFEFRAGIAPLPQLGSIGDLWISWDAGDPSVWFKVEEIEWERWGGCASSVREVSSLAASSYPPYSNLTAHFTYPNLGIPFPLNHTANQRETSFSGRRVPVVLPTRLFLRGQTPRLETLAQMGPISADPEDRTHHQDHRS